MNGKTPHILVTGASGFLGKALCARLVGQNLRVTALVRSPQTSLPDGVKRWVGPALPDLAHDVDVHLAGVDVVVHAAGRAHQLKDMSIDPLSDFRRVNTEGALNLARAAAAAGVKRFIYVSSIGVHGSQSGAQPFRFDDTPHPDTPYTQSKWEAEQALNALQAASTMQVLHVRPPMIYGPAAPGNFALLARLVSKSWPLPLGALSAPRSFVALDNVVDLLAHLACQLNPPSGVYLVADAQVTTTTRFIEAIALGMGKTLRLWPVPLSLLQGLAALLGRGDQVRKMAVPLAVDWAATRERVLWTPPVSMEEAMRRAFAEPQTSSPHLENLL